MPLPPDLSFQLTAARRRLQPRYYFDHRAIQVSTHSRSKAAASIPKINSNPFYVSTHSRSKAAAGVGAAWSVVVAGFNSQPFEGGCLCARCGPKPRGSFNSQPPEGGCRFGEVGDCQRRGFNSQPPEGGCPSSATKPPAPSGFNSQPLEGGCQLQNHESPLL